MSKLKVPAALLVVGAMSLGTSAIAAPVTPLTASAKQMAQQTDLALVRYGGWHGGRGFPAVALAGALIGGAIAAPYYGSSYAYYGGGDYSSPANPFGYATLFPDYDEYRRCHPYCGWGG